MGTDVVEPLVRFRRANELLRTAAVTGTNGKTTTTSMIESIVCASKEPSARLTTLGAWVRDRKIECESPWEEFLQTVEDSVKESVRTLALEVTSKALLNGLSKRWKPTVAVFTNLSRDHLDLHKSAEAYLAAKAQLFMALSPGGCAILNRDDPSCMLIPQVLRPGVEWKSFSRNDPESDLRAERVFCTADGTQVQLSDSILARGLGGELQLSIIGSVHAENAIAAALATDVLGYSYDAIKTGLESFRGVAGRFEVVARKPLTVVDYAHTPEGLEGTLKTARELVTVDGRLICVFGCGGNRDTGKRPQMGKLAHELSDIAILTNDNPRYEDQQQIADQIKSGAAGAGASWSLRLNRREAIESAIRMANENDVVVIAGKGHEQTQEIQGVETPFSDRAVAREVLGEK